ncbi:hypothetical protein [Limosilactobacillus reuteri]|uniref:Uncharacterized protein n=1 Tax=Limosilactobacillus reuteri TaxID=1598 RepID=A0A0U5CUP1_LIMRT|nr:hypothetical protein [Limosilactobacillus reuteri]OTA83558.1 hypothetical protein BHL84_09965 [Limosilactobacillus reuteri]CUR36901.1 hypothetical protein LRLP16767_LRPG3B_00693 [Limosilactobacillus reuteri]
MLKSKAQIAKELGVTKDQVAGYIRSKKWVADGHDKRTQLFSDEKFKVIQSHFGTREDKVQLQLDRIENKLDKILAQIANNEAEVERETKSNKGAEVERKTKSNKGAEFETTKKALAEQLETLSQTFYREMYAFLRTDVVPLNKKLDEWSGHANFVSVVRWSEHPERYGNEIYAISSGLMVRVLDRLAEICRAKNSQTIAKQHFRYYSKENQRKVAQALWIWVTKNDPKITSK